MRTHLVKVNRARMVFPNGNTYEVGDIVDLSPEQFARLRQSLFTEGALSNLGVTLDPDLAEVLDERITSSGGHADHTYLDEHTHRALLPPPILTSPNGSKYRLRVADNGTLSTAFVAYDPEPAGTSGRGYMSESGGRLISSTSYAFKGDPMVTDEPLTITGLSTEADFVAGGQYRGVVLIGDDVVEEILGISDVVSPAITGYGSLDFPLAPINVAAGVKVVVMTGRVDAGDAHVYPVDAYDGSRSGFSWQGIPATDVGISCSRIVTANPVVGTPINRGKGYNSAPFNVKVDWTQEAI